MDNTLNERVARFIARYRTVAAKSSLTKIDETIEFDEVEGGDALISEAEELKRIKLDSEIVRAAQDEEIRYQELLEQDIVARLLSIRGVESVEILNASDTIGHVESLRVTIQAYYLYDDVFYDAGKWTLGVDMLDADDNAFNPQYHWYRGYALDDGTCFKATTGPLSYGEVSQPFKSGSTDHPWYEDSEYGFCFGDSSADIRAYLLTGEFVSAFQLISLCLYHVNEGHEKMIPYHFNEAKNVDTRKLADYFDLDDEDIIRINKIRQSKADKAEATAKNTEGGETFG